MTSSELDGLNATGTPDVYPGVQHRGFLWTLTLASVSLAGPGEARSRRAELESLIQTERAFAQASVTEGMDLAFARYFAPVGIQFLPHPVEFRRGVGAVPASDTAAPERPVLNWNPKLAGVSQSGDLGFTTGPFALERPNSGKGASRKTDHGQFFSVWRREPDGAWRVVLDLGVKLPKPSAALTGGQVEELRLPPPPPDQPTLREVRQSDVIAAREVESVRRRSLSAQKEDLVELWSETGRWYREGLPPRVGKAQVRAGLLARTGFTRLQPLAQAVAKSSDLGFSYGRYAIESKVQPERGYYARLWRRDRHGYWRIALEVTRPLRL